jgi:hypothetical protein
LLKNAVFHITIGGDVNELQLTGVNNMPEIARFYGLVVKMFFTQSEHNPPHIHVVYGERVGAFAIETGEMYEGDLPTKAQGLVKEWLTLHRDELLNIWNTQAFRKLPPLD